MRPYPYPLSRRLLQLAVGQGLGGDGGGDEPLLVGEQHERARRPVAHVGGGGLVAPLARGPRVEDRADGLGELGALLRVAAQRGALRVEE